MLSLTEEAVLNALTEAWNQYVGLAVEHDDDLREFRDAIHRAQGLIAIRVARRVDPATWARK